MAVQANETMKQNNNTVGYTSPNQEIFQEDASAQLLAGTNASCSSDVSGTNQEMHPDNVFKITLRLTRSEIMHLIDAEQLSPAIQLAIVETGELEFISKLLDKHIASRTPLAFKAAIKIALTEVPELITKLNQTVYRKRTKYAIIMAGANEFVLQLLERKNLCEKDQILIAKNGNSRHVKKLIKREDLTTYAQLMIAKIPNVKILKKLLKRKELAIEVQRFIANSKNKRLVYKLLDRFVGMDIDVGVQRIIAKRGDSDLLFRLLAHDNLDPEVQIAIAQTGDDMLISILVENDLVDEAKTLIIKSGSTFISDVIKHGNLSNKHIALIIKTGDKNLISMLIEYLANDSVRAILVPILKSGRSDLIDSAVKILEAEDKDTFV